MGGDDVIGGVHGSESLGDGRVEIAKGKWNGGDMLGRDAVEEVGGRLLVMDRWWGWDKR